jgi:hypothetical protein
MVVERFRERMQIPGGIERIREPLRACHATTLQLHGHQDSKSRPSMRSRQVPASLHFLLFRTLHQRIGVEN